MLIIYSFTNTAGELSEMSPFSFNEVTFAIRAHQFLEQLSSDKLDGALNVLHNLMSPYHSLPQFSSRQHQVRELRRTHVLLTSVMLTFNICDGLLHMRNISLTVLTHEIVGLVVAL